MSRLDALLDAARDAEPDPISEGAADAMIRAARARADREETPGERERPATPAGGADALTHLLDAARASEPSPLNELEVRRLAQRAAMTGGARHRAWVRRRVLAVTGVAAAIAAAAVTLLVIDTPAPPPVADRAPAPVLQEASEPTDLELPTGDRIVAAAGARFGVEMAEASDRRVRLDGGAMLFDVRPIEGGRFRVSTPEAEVVVLGTVFTVRSGSGGTTVRVYEGRVEVRGPHGPRLVSAGGSLHVGSGRAAPDVLVDEGRRAATERRELARAPDSAEPAAIEELPSRGPTAGAEPRSPSAGSREAASRRPNAGADGASEGAGAGEPSAASGDEEPATPDAARAWIAGGAPERALAVARDAVARGENDPWRLLEGDALRALGRVGEAADTYRRAASELPAPRRQQAGFLEARLRAGELGDPAAGVRALRDAEVAAPGSALRERGLALEAQLLARLGRREELAEVASAYLREFPRGSQAEAMRAHAAAATAEDE